LVGICGSGLLLVAREYLNVRTNHPRRLEQVLTDRRIVDHTDGNMTELLDETNAIGFLRGRKGRKLGLVPDGTFDPKRRPTLGFSMGRYPTGVGSSTWILAR
jgi:hypothetical protein